VEESNNIASDRRKVVKIVSDNFHPAHYKPPSHNLPENLHREKKIESFLKLERQEAGTENE
jgi:hypothetical protein